MSRRGDLNEYWLHRGVPLRALSKLGKKKPSGDHPNPERGGSAGGERLGPGFRVKVEGRISQDCRSAPAFLNGSRGMRI